MNKINMIWGSPDFLTPYWDSISIKTDQFKKPLQYEFGSNFFLKEKITELHNFIENAETKGKRIVVANGATPLLQALMFLLSKKKKTTCVFAPSPCFSRLKPLTEYLGLTWKKTKKAVVINTVPNNPDGDVKKIYSDVLDLVYYWPQYLKIKHKINHNVMLFGLSKATGHASTRIGWVLLEDHKLADELEKYIEVTSGGLSIDAQFKAISVIDATLKQHHSIFDDGKITLDLRWNKINQIEHLLPFKIMNKGEGMFLWAKGVCPKEILSLNGKEMNSSKDYFRLNLGCSEETFNRFINLFTKN
jgi:aspartate/methionine/tyrosine aminotransferase